MLLRTGLAAAGMALVGERRARAVDEVPTAEIRNDRIRVNLYLPDAARGYYRGTRFDWSGMLGSLANHFPHRASGHDRSNRVGTPGTVLPGTGVFQLVSSPVTRYRSAVKGALGMSSPDPISLREAFASSAGPQ
jgi:hypothetical protein